MKPLVSVITPTWQRHELLIERCIPSVQAQDYSAIEHIVVSDGPDEELNQADLGVRYFQLACHPQLSYWGNAARLLGLEHATGDFIAYLDDDNAFRPQHIGRLVADMEKHDRAGFTYSQMKFHHLNGDSFIVGSPPPRCGQIDTSIILHRREILEVATWEGGRPTVDWDLVERWMVNGVVWSFVDEITVDYYKS